MNLGSTSKNINILTMLITIIVILGAFNITMFTMDNIIITIVSYYVLNILGVFMTLHRYYSHKSFAFRYKWIEWLFTCIALLAGRGSPLGWVYIHRQHHAYSDTEKDPHSPKYLGYKLFGFGHFKSQENDMQIFLVKDMMTKYQLFIHKWYIGIILLVGVILALVSYQIFYFIWILPVFLVGISQSNFNYFGHISGYRNFETKDDSRNNKWLFPFILGEAWHNNHHAKPKEYSTQVRSTEFDPVMYVIEIVKNERT
jgi:fatty-acid desaturase